VGSSFINQFTQYSIANSANIAKIANIEMLGANSNVRDLRAAITQYQTLPNCEIGHCFGAEL
jgi:hypothetical protein